MEEKEGQDIFLFFWEKKWFILLPALVASGIAFIITLLLTPKYSSTLSMYAASTVSSDKILDDQQFGFPMYADRFIQVLKSNLIRDSLVNKFNLINHYDIDTTERKWPYELNKAYWRNIDIERTLLMSIEITVSDKDPDLAAKMANEMARLADEVVAYVVKKNTYDAMKSAEKSYFEKLDQINKLAGDLAKVKGEGFSNNLSNIESDLALNINKLKELRVKVDKLRNKYKAHDLNTYIDQLRELLTEAKARYSLESGRLKVYDKSLPAKDSLRIKTEADVEGTKLEVDDLKEQLEDVVKYNKEYNELGDEIGTQLNLINRYKVQIRDLTTIYEPEVENVQLEKLRSQFSSEMDVLNNLKKKYDMAKVKYEDPVPNSYVISPAEPNYKKTFPRKKVIVAVTFFATIFFATITLLIIEKIKEERS